MDEYDIQVELYKGEDSVALDEIFDDPGDRELTSVLYKSIPVLESGEADRAVIYIAKDGELLELKDYSAAEYDAKQVFADIEAFKQERGA